MPSSKMPSSKMPSSPRVLVIAYYFPPSGGPGVQRVLKFVKYLAEFGWRPSVLTVREGAYPEYDPSLARDIPDAVPVHRTYAWDPYRWYARLTGRSDEDSVSVGSVRGRGASWKESVAQWIRANVFLPDARVGWVPFGAMRGRTLLSEQPFDAMLTSGPPHSVHLIGALLHRWTGTPWVADFRDPWTDINYYQELPHTPPARRLDAALERAVLRSASAVTTVSPSWRALLARKAGSDAGPCAVVHNGFDPEDFEGERAAVSRDHFVLTYVGSLYASRNPEGLWRALSQLRTREAVPKLRLRLVGRVDPGVLRALQDRGLEAITERVPYVPHAEAVRYMQQAALLLLTIESFPRDEGMITGKLYEYLAAGRPVLGIGPPGGDGSSRPTLGSSSPGMTPRELQSSSRPSMLPGARATLRLGPSPRSSISTAAARRQSGWPRC